MKLLVVCQYYYPEPFRVTDICESLVKRGHSITVLTGLPNYPEGKVLDNYRYGKKRNEIINGVNVIRSFEIGRGNSRYKLFLNYFSYTISSVLKVLFLKEEFDAVMVNQLSPVLMGIPAMVYKSIHHKKMLMYCLDLWPASLAACGIREESFVYKLFYKISRWIYDSADMILVTSSMFIEYFNDVLKLNKNISYLPQYAEDFFSVDNTDNEIILMKKSEIFNFVFAGNIGEMQSVETIIRAANELKEIPNIVFHIVGDGSKLLDCEYLAKEFGLTNIIFHGRKPLKEMPKFYKLADAMLVTLRDNKTLSYTLPGKVQTYMAAKKPIIGSINGETKQVIEKSGCGLCCNAENYIGLANLIQEFCMCEKRDTMSENAQIYYYENYSKDKVLSKLENVLNKIMED